MTKICECGLCNRVVKNRFCKGHAFKGKHFSKIHCKRISVSNKKRYDMMTEQEKEIWFAPILEGGRKFRSDPLNRADVSRKQSIFQKARWVKTKQDPQKMDAVRLHAKNTIGREDVRLKTTEIRRNAHYPCSEDKKKKISAANSGEKNGMFGKTHTQEYRTRLSNEMQGKDLRKDVTLEKRQEWCRKGANATYTKIKNNGFCDTGPERRVKMVLDKLGKHIIPQYFISDIVHSYYADFYLPEFKTIIEVDGVYWHDYPNLRPIDKKRNDELAQRGYNIIRIWETETTTPDRILDILKLRAPLLFCK
jgi:G:T-mismatch repair DNA endonuclease (very short patch repair protein)